MLLRSVRTVRRFLFSKTSAAILLGAGVGALCAAAGLAAVAGGSVCAVGAIVASSLFRTLFAVSPFGVKPAIPLTLGSLLATDFERNLDATAKLLPVAVEVEPTPSDVQSVTTTAF
ncbi:hypothetical protein cyc_09013 [Cyclospora cayetanensis]|uniref:Uncharacterized protein n=1 Tax=Cyclospora cayetanensis TaxID=88456 RepID=A0A1D3CWB6_9EIME|nr:hypothetical protein cyc_09013 [Cyclospora cayetanensis]